MDIQKNKNEILAGIGILLVLVLMVWGGITLMKNADIRDEAERIASVSLVEQKNVSSSSWDVPLVARFVQLEDVNVATVRYGDNIVQKTDYNKSKILGKYVAVKFTEAKKGWMDGLKEKSRFKEKGE